jgi:hypothetical protein
MGELQTLLALVVLIFVLAVIVQAIQEILKSFLNTKCDTMEKVISQFMGNKLPLAQVKTALGARGLDITALESFTKADFRKLLDGIPLQNQQLEGLVTSANASLDELKDNVASAYEGARLQFQKAYSQKNKRWVMVISFLLVLVLNASIVRLYEVLSVDQKISQSIAGTASSLFTANQEQSNSGAAQDNKRAEDNAMQIYESNRKVIEQQLNKYPILLRTTKYKDDIVTEPIGEILGLIIMGLLVSLGAPFWNDVLKGVMGVNNALNTSANKSKAG